jgi:hypothetical protein
MNSFLGENQYITLCNSYILYNLVYIIIIIGLKNLIFVAYYTRPIKYHTLSTDSILKSKVGITIPIYCKKLSRLKDYTVSNC